MNRIYNTLIDWVIISLIVLLIMALSGCITSYSISKTAPDGSQITVETKSYREFTQPKIEYVNADGTIFKFNADSVTTATSPIEQAVADVIRATPSAILPVPN